MAPPSLSDGHPKANYAANTREAPHDPFKSLLQQQQPRVHEVEFEGNLSGDEEQTDMGLAEKSIEHDREQQASFGAFVYKRLASMVLEDKILVEEHGEKAGDLSLTDIMARKEYKHIIASPRDYQMELFEKSKANNTIAVLDTGSGKTLIAVLLLRHVVELELERRSCGLPNRLAIFLVPKIVLVFQQHAVLEANLDCTIERICGEMGKNWESETWRRHLASTMIIVCTPQCLLEAMRHSFIRIEDISILVFDEAHHAKKSHPYAAIIQEYYHRETNLSKRPLIFGTTASPVDATFGDDLTEKTEELEQLLDAQIVTASDGTMIAAFSRRPEEEIAEYTRLPLPFHTPLHERLEEKYGIHNEFSKLFKESEILARELGLWCAEAFWKFGLTEKEQSRQEQRTERKFHRSLKRSAKEIDMQALDDQITRLREAFHVTKAHNYTTPTSVHVSSKVNKLAVILRQRFERVNDMRCLIFVERRSTARLLSALFSTQEFGTTHLKPGFLIGSNNATVAGEHNSYKQQAVTMVKFRKGELNCLFATSVAEEGLDIQDCNLVVRFDPCKTTISYIQSRGRARHRNSTFVHMLEKENLREVNQLEIVQEGEKLLADFCKTLPENRLLKGNDADWQETADGEDEVAILPTGARLSYDFSLVVLAHFLNRIPHDPQDDMTVTHNMQQETGMFRCEILFPECCPIRRAIGRWATRKSVAKRSAAFEACKELYQLEYLDGHLLPTYQKQLPELRNARLALASKTTDMYDVLQKPAFWSTGRGSVPTQIYVNFIELLNVWDRPVEPLALITRQSLPDVPEFSICRLGGSACLVSIQCSHSPVDLTPLQVQHLTDFTLRIFRDLFAKTFEPSDPNMSYWLAPTTLKADKSRGIDWDMLLKLFHQASVKWTEDMPHTDLENRFFVDPWHGGRRYFSRSVAPGMKINDPVPGDADAKGKTKGRVETVIGYTVSLFKKSRERRSWNASQPVLLSDRIMHRLNVLAEPSEAEQSAVIKAYICPEPLNISLLPTAIASMGLVFPAIIHRLESYLIALECTKRLGLIIPADLALEAITKDSDNQDSHDMERINFQRGMGPNYERLEFIGDCFLKMATSIAIYVSYASHDQFSMHCDRMILLCNRTLFDFAQQNGYQQYIRGKSFERRNWYPECLRLLEGKAIGKSENKLSLGKKTIADVCEALIGAAYVTHIRIEPSKNTDFDQAVKAVQIFTDTEQHRFNFTQWSHFNIEYSKHLPTYQTAPASAAQVELARKIVSEHPYEFRHPKLLACAFKHPTSPSFADKLPSYERLEFLGDSLIDMACVTYLYQNFPDKDPQWLTEHKMPMVCNLFLGCLCVKLGFHRHLRHTSSPLRSAIEIWVAECKEAERESDGVRDYWQTLREPPKCLPDIVESYVGAVFIDSGFSYAAVQVFFDTHIRWFFEDMTPYDSFAGKHPISRLRRFLDDYMGCTAYRLMAHEVPVDDGSTRRAVLAALVVHGRVVGDEGGFAPTMKAAKTKAALEAMELLEGMAPFAFRQKFGCDCVGSGSDIFGDGEIGIASD